MGRARSPLRWNATTRRAAAFRVALDDDLRRKGEAKALGPSLIRGHWVYFIQVDVDGGGPIKIGWATEPYSRLRELQTAHSERLRLIGAIPAPDRHLVLRLESALHAKFRKHHIRGEWFRPAPEIVARAMSSWESHEEIRNPRDPYRNL